MTGLAIVCSGQGGLSGDMFEFAADHAAGRQVLDAFGEVFETGLIEQARGGADLARNAVAQPLTVACSLANWAVLAPMLPEPSLFAGYSAGELAAWGCSGIWDAHQAARACRKRCELMEACAPADGGMLAVRGLPLAAIASFGEEAGAHVAIVNEDDHAVLAGLRPALQALQARLEARGAWTRLLDVSVPSHSPLLAPAAQAFAQWAAQAPASPPRAPVLMGIDGEPCGDPAAGLRALARAIGEPIAWREAMQTLASQGIQAVLELGPGRSLAALVQQAQPQMQARAVGDFRTPEGVAGWVARMLD